ncbi:hypothetical protein AC578_7143 [Pseudocercospora eumusae]|uniref:Uncharacterized protein n=1 Tax=Pseudocercospora eumusae TaxID=321146 RepID=A0A139HX86_9PEZI|nr:hypothetical protein AC578_7143 [Pseudocercospora eumusae]
MFVANTCASTPASRDMADEATSNPHVGLMAQPQNQVTVPASYPEKPSSDRQRRGIVYLRHQANRKRNHDRRLSSAELGVEYGLPEVIAWC